MDLGKLLSDPGALASLIAVFLAAILTLIINVIYQIWGEKRKQLQVTFSRTIETPSILAESEINKNLHISYQGKNVSDLKFFSVNITNIGKQQIDDFQFICEFDSNIQNIDTNFPEVSTKALPTIQPDLPLLDQTNSTNHKFQYITKSFTSSQTITVNFLFAYCKKDTFEVKFLHPQYEIHEGNASSFTTLEMNIISAITNFLVFYVISQASPIISIFAALLGGIIAAIFASFSSTASVPTSVIATVSVLSSVITNVGDLIGIIIGLPFLLKAYRSARSIIPIIARKLQEKL